MAEKIKSFQASFQMMRYSGYVCVQCKEGYAQVIQHEGIQLSSFKASFNT